MTYLSPPLYRLRRYYLSLAAMGKKFREYSSAPLLSAQHWNEARTPPVSQRDRCSTVPRKLGVLREVLFDIHAALKDRAEARA